MFIAWNCLYPTDTSCTRLTPPHVFYIINGLRFWVIIVGAAPSECIQPTWPSFSVHVSVYLTLLYFLLVPVWFLGLSHAGGGTLWTRCIQPLEHCYMSHQYILVNCTVLWGHREAGSGSEVSIPTPPHFKPTHLSHTILQGFVLKCASPTYFMKEGNRTAKHFKSENHHALEES